MSCIGNCLIILNMNSQFNSRPKHLKTPSSLLNSQQKHYIVSDFEDRHNLAALASGNFSLLLTHLYRSRPLFQPRTRRRWRQWNRPQRQRLRKSSLKPPPTCLIRRIGGRYLVEYLHGLSKRRAIDWRNHQRIQIFKKQQALEKGIECGSCIEIGSNV